ncbi:MAG: sensor histidine kinase, partial [Spirochaetota bacterium]
SEKETLLRELYHRTKNNMYLIISLLGLRESELSSEADRVIFREMSGRIRTMALVHEKLYRSPDLSHILFDDYLRELVALLAEGLPADGIRFEFDLESVELSVDQALPLGLVIYELLVNSLRHAFPEGRGRVGLGLHPLRDGRIGRLELIVWDDGIGLPEGFDPSKGESMGFQIVTSIVEHQLGGAISFGGVKGTRCSIVVPMGEAEKMTR